jgi:copper chaperone
MAVKKADEGASMPTATFHVDGMTCAHCVKAVTGELERIDGVDLVEIDLASGAVTVTSSQPLADDTVRHAIDEAGYALRA